MAATLPNFPAELLLNICELADKPQVCYRQLCATSSAISDKIVWSQGQRLYRQSELSLNAAGFEQFHAISCGQLAFHVPSVTTSCYALLDHESIRYRSGYTRQNNGPDAGEPTIRERFHKIHFDDSAFDRSRNGKCDELLRSALVMLPNLTRICIIRQCTIKANPLSVELGVTRAK
jgi:hypothetical protein